LPAGLRRTSLRALAGLPAVTVPRAEWLSAPVAYLPTGVRRARLRLPSSLLSGRVAGAGWLSVPQA
ncbi:hypothetical protein ACH4UX_15540, partial [Streptomyces althioticus]|uniref:hypothetical protein n=1 Tax=Streptomyces althioticus TaxID=83380 RepID=UPI003793DEF8